MATKKKTPVKVVKKRLTAAEKRVLIAKDTIKWLKTHALRVRPGTYFLAPIGSLSSKSDTDKLDVALGTIEGSCTVCGLGGMFYSMVRRFDKVTVGLSAGDQVHGHTIYEQLGKYFSTTQLSLIESAFEVQAMTANVTMRPNFNWDEVNRAVDFAWGKEPADRLRKIMNNIINNGGTFRP